MKTNVTTRRIDFYRVAGKVDSEMLEVKKGLPADITLEFASHLLDSCEGLTFEYIDEGLSPAATYALNSLLQQAKAMVDAVWGRLEVEMRSDVEEILANTEG